MGSAARRDVKAGDLDEPERPRPIRLLAKRQACSFLRGGETDSDRMILPDNPVGPVLGSFDVCGGQRSVEIDRRRRRTEVEALGAGADHAIERGRQHMLPGVLLHVLESSVPVNLAVDDLQLSIASRNDPAFEFAFENMENLAILGAHDVDDTGRTEVTGVKRLSA